MPAIWEANLHRTMPAVRSKNRERSSRLSLNLKRYFAAAALVPTEKKNPQQNCKRLLKIAAKPKKILSKEYLMEFLVHNFQAKRSAQKWWFKHSDRLPVTGILFTKREKTAFPIYFAFFEGKKLLVHIFFCFLWELDLFGVFSPSQAPTLKCWLTLWEMSS